MSGKVLRTSKENSKNYEPIVVMKKNRKKPLVVVDAEFFVGLLELKNGTINEEGSN